MWLVCCLFHVQNSTINRLDNAKEYTQEASAKSRGTYTDEQLVTAIEKVKSQEISLEKPNEDMAFQHVLLIVELNLEAYKGSLDLKVYLDNQTKGGR
ncbi:unnamed protein product [Acanthoscelides obtectus]|uniref:Uncharacterized protein n=1 Tax=Acanthoscelides obtectus TaxID=200917 RepID=A0A9P0QFW4_ACAOB|nr:unnamed protein product [Acanthoscelides obtectus]CAK1679555.1 hypothetical protein AOBTE_LOCUS32347 [Acanthoscelides obtectus]